MHAVADKKSVSRASLTAAMIVAVLAVVMLLLPSLAMADDASRYRDEISQYNQRLTTLRGGDAASMMRNELDQTDKWLQEALVQVGKEQYKKVQALLRRADVQLDYVEASVDLAAVSTAAEEMQTRLGEMKARANELQTELETLQAQENELQSKLASP